MLRAGSKLNGLLFLLFLVNADSFDIAEKGGGQDGHGVKVQLHFLILFKDLNL